MHSETRHADLQFATNWSTLIRPNSQIAGYRSIFGPPRGSMSGTWEGLELNEPFFAVQTWTAGRLPRQVANTTCRWWSNQWGKEIENSTGVIRKPITTQTIGWTWTYCLSGCADIPKGYNHANLDTMSEQTEISTWRLKENNSVYRLQ